MSKPFLWNKSPFECLFHQLSDYAFLYTFWCLWFPFLWLYNAHKLDYHYTLCVFLSYSSSHLGCRCLNLSSNHIYISHHVWFYEQSFLFLESVNNSTSTSHTPPPTTITHLSSLTIFLTTPASNTPLKPINPFVLLSSSAFISLDYFASTSSATSTLSIFVSSFVVVSTTPPSSSSSPSRSSTYFLSGLDLCVDLSRYSLPR